MPDFTSSTQAVPDAGEVPRHVAIIMDGNGRWAKKRFLPRVGGHRKGVEAVREAVKACVVARPGREVDAANVIAWARERIAPFKVPKSVDVIALLPRNPSGKILRRQLREPYWEGRERRVN